MSTQQFETNSGAKILDAIADHLFWTIRGMSNEQLEKTLTAAKRVNSTNCPYQRFDAVKAILPFCIEEKRDRECRKHAFEKANEVAAKDQKAALEKVTA